MTEDDFEALQEALREQAIDTYGDDDLDLVQAEVANAIRSFMN